MDERGSGEVRKSLELLWGGQPARSRGPQPRLSLAQILRAALELADAEGLEAVSMRRLAEVLDVTAMALYKHVPGKSELIALMVDAAYGELSGDMGPDDSPEAGWRGRLEAIAFQNQALYLRHPWMLQVSLSRPVLGPHALAKYDRELRALEGLGLSDVEMDAALTLVLQFVTAATRSALEAQAAIRHTGMTDAQWWEAHAPILAELVDPQRFPLANRVGTSAGQAQQGPYGADFAFTFGLQRLLDGLEAYLHSPQSRRIDG